MFLHFVYKIHKHEPQTWGMDRLYGLTWYNDWRAFVLAVGLSCVGVLVSHHILHPPIRSIHLNIHSLGHLIGTFGLPYD